MNRVELTGGLTRDAKVNSDGIERVEITIAVNGTRWSKEANAQVVKTLFVTCVLWGPVAVEHMSLLKGDEVHVVGELDQYKNEDRDRPSTRVTVFACTLIREGRAHRQHAAVAPVGAEVGSGAQDPWL